MKCLFVSARSCTILLDENGDYFSDSRRAFMLNGECVDDERSHVTLEEERSVFSLFGLWPDTEYKLESYVNLVKETEISFRTEKEVCSLNVRRFGAKGDKQHDDTGAIQAAILSCPAGGRVLIPKGDYLTGPLFLKSHITIELKPDAALYLKTDREQFPVLPA